MAFREPAAEGAAVSPRSNSAAVRNPIAGDEKVRAILAELSPEGREILARVLTRLAHRWRDQAAHSWHKHKAPMAAYHKANAVNARHLALAIRKVQP